MAFLFEPSMAAEFETGAAFRFGASEPGAFEIVGAVLDVRAQLLFEVIFDRRAVKQAAGEGTQGSRKSHISSGSAARAEAMAVARRFQPSASSRRRLRPCGVSW